MSGKHPKLPPQRLNALATMPTNAKPTMLTHARPTILTNAIALFTDSWQTVLTNASQHAHQRKAHNAHCSHGTNLT